MHCAVYIRIPNQPYCIKLYIALLVSSQEYYESIERDRQHTFETLALKYRAIGPLLTKMEGLVVHTNTGNSPRLHAYYAYWERKVYDTLTKVGNDLAISHLLKAKWGNVK